MKYIFLFFAFVQTAISYDVNKVFDSPSSNTNLFMDLKITDERLIMSNLINKYQLDHDFNLIGAADTNYTLELNNQISNISYSISISTSLDVILKNNNTNDIIKYSHPSNDFFVSLFWDMDSHGNIAISVISMQRSLLLYYDSENKIISTFQDDEIDIICPLFYNDTLLLSANTNIIYYYEHNNSTLNEYFTFEDNSSIRLLEKYDDNVYAFGLNSTATSIYIIKNLSSKKISNDLPLDFMINDVHFMVKDILILGRTINTRDAYCLKTNNEFNNTEILIENNNASFRKFYTFKNDILAIGSLGSIWLIDTTKSSIGHNKENYQPISFVMSIHYYDLHGRIILPQKIKDNIRSYYKISMYINGTAKVEKIYNFK
jgi:hypothetical protein